MKKIIYITLLICGVFNTKAQIKDSVPNFYDDIYIINQPDADFYLELDEVAILPKHKFKSHIDVNYYKWFQKKVHKAYPYAVMASNKLDSINERLNSITSKRKKRKYIKRVQEYIEGEFTDQLKKMTRTEGRILIKLIHRQTGKTAFENIKELRSGWKAFWYNAKANLFAMSLKDKYQPQIENEDYLIEDVLQRAFLNKTLEKQDPKIHFDALKILSQKKGAIDVEYYKLKFSKGYRRSVKSRGGG